MPSNILIVRTLLLFIVPVINCQSSIKLPSNTKWKKGIVFGGDEWSAYNTTFGTSSADLSLLALAQTGADHVRILTTQYQDYINTTTIYPINNMSSPLATATISQLQHTISRAHSLGLSVFLAPILDPNWDIPVNGRSITPPNGATAVSRLQIGKDFTENDWTEWFISYTNYILPLAQLAQSESVEMFEICSELDIALTSRGDQFRILITAIKNVYTGPLYIAANFDTLSRIDFIDQLDAIGVDAYYSLGEILPLGISPTVDDLITAWEPIKESLKNLSITYNKPILITEVGYQSRPSCHVRPWGTVVHDPLDDSAWLEDHDMSCQANAYEALFRVFSNEEWFAGVFWWLWRADTTAGGTGCSDFTPHGKPAEFVLRRWYNGNLTSDITGSLAISDAIVNSLYTSSNTNKNTSTLLNTRQKGIRAEYNGFVFGGPDQWSSPYVRYDSPAAALSLSNMIESTGSDTVEIIVQWYVTDVNSTEIYPILDSSNPLRTSTDDELSTILSTAKTYGLKTALTLMLDPDWTLPAQNFCRGNVNNDPKCHWRGEIGIYWGTDCSLGSQWDTFFIGYTNAVLHYAKLAEKMSVDIYLLSHELQQAVTVCPLLWQDQLNKVRSVYKGLISTAFNPDGDSILPDIVTSASWVQSLDFIGVDCYFTPPLPPFNGSTSLNPNDVHPPLPWQDLDEDELVIAYNKLMPPFAALSQAIGNKKIVCTEVGWASRPWTYAYRAGTPRLDGEDCSVWDQCVSLNAQALAYSTFLKVYSTQPWYNGVLFWTWRADPTVGGTSDDGFSPAGKPASTVCKTFWGV
jgi:hypothetical protein